MSNFQSVRYRQFLRNQLGKLANFPKAQNLEKAQKIMAVTQAIAKTNIITKYHCFQDTNDISLICKNKMLVSVDINP